MSNNIAVLPTDNAESTGTARVFHEYPGAAYVLPADEQERQRLERQHKMLLELMDGRLLSENITLSDGASVLDSGTGTGIWVLDVASKSSPSTTTFHGIDITALLFPPNPPPNVSFSVTSILSLPTDWSGKFDLIHQRLLVVALLAPEWRQAVAEMFRALKPGGQVQLTEMLNQITCPDGLGPDSATERTKRLINEFVDRRGILASCALEIPRLLVEAGFVDVTVYERKVGLGSWAGEQGIAWRTNYLNVFRGLKTALLRTEGMSWKGTEQELDELADATQKEWDTYPGSHSFFFTFTARKPL